MTENSRATAKAEEVLQKMQATLSINNINANNSMASSAEVENILGQMRKEAMGQSNRKHMQVIGLEEEVRLKEVTIRGLHSKISVMERQIHQSNAKILNLEVLQSENKELKAVIKEHEAKSWKTLEEEKKKLQEDMKSLKEKNTKVLQTAKEHQKGWKNHISKLEAQLLEKENENRLLRAKMARFVKKLEGTIGEFSDLNDQDGLSLSLADTSESENCVSTEEENQESRDESEVETKMEKYLNARIDPIADKISPVADKINKSGFFKRFQAANE
jgi:hypothetical protein